MAGDDSLYGGLGNDVITGGDGDDTLGSDAGDDVFYGGNGNDRISGGADSDQLFGGEGSDVLDGGAGGDRLIGGERGVPRRDRRGCDNDSLAGAAGDDTLDGGRGRDLIDPGSDVNDVTADPDRDTIVEGVGQIRLTRIRKSDARCDERGGGKGRARSTRPGTRFDPAVPPRGRRDEGPEQSRPPRGNDLQSAHATGVVRTHNSSHTGADLSIHTTTSAASVPSGESLSYTLALRNAGPQKAKNVVFYDTLPNVPLVSGDARNWTAGPANQPECVLDAPTELVCQVGDLKVAAGDLVTIDFQVMPDTPPGNNIGNTGTVNSATPDSKKNNTETVTTPVTAELPVVIIEATDALATEGSSDTGQFRVTRHQVASSSLAVKISVSGNATSGTDYQSLATTVTIPANECCAVLALTPNEDSNIEGPEKVIVTIQPQDGVYRTEYRSDATVEIADNDAVRPTVSLSVVSHASETGPTIGKALVTRDPVSNRSLTVTYSIGYGGLGVATPGQDYIEPTTYRVTIQPNQTTAEIAIVPMDDAAVEGTESVFLYLDHRAEYVHGITTSARIDIADNDTTDPPLVSITADSDAAEGVPPDIGTFTISRSGDTSKSLTVVVSIGGTADKGFDYRNIPTNIVISAKESHVTVQITPINDGVRESSETVVLTLVDKEAYDVGSPGEATLTIADNANIPEVTITAEDDRAGEGMALDTGLFRVSRTGVTFTEVTVKFTVTGTATSDADYTAIGTTVTLAADEPFADIVVTPANDSTPESSETVVVKLFKDAAYTIGTPSQATVIIDDNDGAPCANTGTSLVSLDWKLPEGGVRTPLVPNPWPESGFQVFVDKNHPLDGPHNALFVTARVIPATGNITVHFKAFDPDDIDRAEHLTANDSTIDPNGPKGDDNNGDNNGDPLQGTLQPTSATTDSSGVATTVFYTTKQPGDNFRVAATCTISEFNKLQVNNPNGTGFVPASDSQVSGFNGKVTQLLTVWRRLWVESDSMIEAPVPLPAPSAVRRSGEAFAIASQGGRFRGVVWLTQALPAGMTNDAYEGGRVSLDDGRSFPIVGSQRRNLIVDFGPTPPTSELQALFRAPNSFLIQDDDFSGQLPRYDLLTEGVKAKFRPAYIELVDANEEFIGHPNPQLAALIRRTDIPFELNTPENAGNYVIRAKDLTDEPWFWVQDLVAAYQPEMPADLDPDGRNAGFSRPQEGEDPDAVYGGTWEKLQASLIFLETIRDGGFDIDMVVAHETGHGPGQRKARDDHKEGGLMDARMLKNYFETVTIRRFRITSRWYGPLVRSLK